MPNLPYDQFPETSHPLIPAGENNTMDARILLMLNMVTPEDLVDDQEYGDIYEDVKEESFRYGAAEDLRIPPTNQERQNEIRVWRRPSSPQRANEATGVGQVYVKFVNAQDAQSALKALAGRSFAGRSIIATVLNEDSQTAPPLIRSLPRSLICRRLFPLLERLLLSCWCPVGV